MASGPSAGSLKHLQTLFQAGTVGGLTDGQLLERFVQRGDEAAFAALVERHGPMVFRVCQSRLGDRHDAEDAFQATFFVLAQRARTIRNSEAVGGWLFGVAGRVSARARSVARRRTIAEQKAGLSSRDVTTPPGLPDLQAEVYHALESLPEKYRLPAGALLPGGADLRAGGSPSRLPDSDRTDPAGTGTRTVAKPARSPGPGPWCRVADSGACCPAGIR